MLVDRRMLGVDQSFADHVNLTVYFCLAQALVERHMLGMDEGCASYVISE